MEGWYDDQRADGQARGVRQTLAMGPVTVSDVKVIQQ